MKITVKNTIELLDLQKYIVELGICTEYEFDKIIIKMIDEPGKGNYTVFNTIFINPEYGEYYTNPKEKEIAIAIKKLIENEKDHEILIHWTW